ncbi:MAG: CheR family methyltransferase [Bdellovibrionota bacterium]
MVTKVWHSCVLKVARVVTEETGNRVEEKNLSTIETRLRSRLLRLGLKDLESYEEHFKKHEQEERRALKGLMTTHHTFFFREFQHFDVLQGWIAQKKQAGELKAGSTLKIWSAASSRGQEAYSLSMFLDLHLKQAHGVDFKIFASDIDGESVRYGSNGVYPVKEVQSIPMAYLGSHWSRGTGDIAHFAKAKPSLREKISWHEVNLLEIGAFTKQHGPFDVVFCRNVFIYFEEQKIFSITKDIMSAMNDNALFITGLSEPIPAETLGLLRAGPSSYQIPSRKGMAAISQPVLTVAPKPVAAPAPLRALVVDDSPTIQKLLKKILTEDKSFGHVDLASHGEEARGFLQFGSYDLITLDIHMPVMGGIEFLEQVYKKNSHPPVLVVSSVSREDKGLATRALELGAKDYVEKPDLARMKESAGEILSKAKTLTQWSGAKTSLELDRSFSRDAVISDVASRLRAIEVGSGNASADVVALARSFELESQSPPVLWIFESRAELPALEEKIRKASRRPIAPLPRDGSFAAGTHYLCSTAEFLGLAYDKHLGGVNGFAALLTSCAPEVVKTLERVSATYVLVDETRDTAPLAKLPWVEQAPATSYASLSAEVFAGIRKLRKDSAA